MLESHLENQNNKNEGSSSLPMIEESLELSWDTYYEENRTKAEQYVQENPGRIRIVKSRNYTEENNYFTVMFYNLVPNPNFVRIKVQHNRKDKSIFIIDFQSVFSTLNFALSDILKSIEVDTSKLIFEKKTVIQSITHYIHRRVSEWSLKKYVGLFKKEALEYNKVFFPDLEIINRPGDKDLIKCKVLYIAPIKIRDNIDTEFFFAEYSKYENYENSDLFKNITSLVLDFPKLSHEQREIEINNIFTYYQNNYILESEQLPTVLQNSKASSPLPTQIQSLTNDFQKWYQPQWYSQLKKTGTDPLPICIFFDSVFKSFSSAFCSLEQNNTNFKAKGNFIGYFLLSTQSDLGQETEAVLELNVCYFLGKHGMGDIYLSDNITKINIKLNLIEPQLILEIIKKDVFSRIEKFKSMKILPPNDADSEAINSKVYGEVLELANKNPSLEKRDEQNTTKKGARTILSFSELFKNKKEAKASSSEFKKDSDGSDKHKKGKSPKR